MLDFADFVTFGEKFARPEAKGGFRYADHAHFDTRSQFEVENLVPNARVVLVELKGKLGWRTAIETVERADLVEFPTKICEGDIRVGWMTHPFWKKRIYMHRVQSVWSGLLVYMSAQYHNDSV